MAKLPPRSGLISGFRIEASCVVGGVIGAAGDVDCGSGFPAREGCGWGAGVTGGGVCGAACFTVGAGNEVEFCTSAEGEMGADALSANLPFGCKSMYQSAPPAMTSTARLSKKIRIFSRRFRVLLNAVGSGSTR